jgi:hypothetical protein
VHWKRLAILLLVLACGAFAPRTSASTEDAVAFVRTMLDGVGAEALQCPAEVRQLTRERGMGAVCARFGGTFENFRALWEYRLSPQSLRQNLSDAPLLLSAEAQTGWEASGLEFERIYAVGRTVVGVRFAMGEVIVVYR